MLAPKNEGVVWLILECVHQMEMEDGVRLCYLHLREMKSTHQERADYDSHQTSDRS